MTTVTVVKKDSRIAIVADTLTKWGGGKESAAARLRSITRLGVMAAAEIHDETGAAGAVVFDGYEPGF